MKNENILTEINRYRSEIMGFAALWIFILHEWQLLSVPWSGPYYAERFIKDIGFIGVDMFLLLSGMGLSYAIEKHTLSRFYLRRYKRLVIPTLAAAALRCLLCGWTIPYLLRCLSGYLFIRGDTTAFIWYVYAIAVFYLFFPLYWRFFAGSRRKGLFTLACVLGWYLLFGLLLRKLFSDTSWLVINRIPVFLFGALLGYQERNGGLKRKTAVTVSAIALPIGLALEYICSVYGTKLIMPMPTVFLPSFLVGVSLVFLLADLLTRFEAKPKLLRLLGAVSLEFYCIQEAMGDFLVPRLTDIMPLFAVNLIVFAVVLLCAVLLKKAAELLKI